MCVGERIRNTDSMGFRVRTNRHKSILCCCRIRCKVRQFHVPLRNRHFVEVSFSFPKMAKGRCLRFVAVERVHISSPRNPFSPADIFSEIEISLESIAEKDFVCQSFFEVGSFQVSFGTQCGKTKPHCRLG